MGMRILFRALMLASAVAMPMPLAAHGPTKGLNGGPRVDVGIYHTELLVDGTTTVAVFLSDVDDKPIAAAGFKATAILVVGGKPVQVDLGPVGTSKLAGTAPSPVKPGVKGVVRLTAPDGSTSQGKF